MYGVISNSCLVVCPSSCNYAKLAYAASRNCVVFRLDDVQDFWIDAVQSGNRIGIKYTGDNSTNYMQQLCLTAIPLTRSTVQTRTASSTTLRGSATQATTCTHDTQTDAGWWRKVIYLAA
jgi:hypothetical protein